MKFVFSTFLIGALVLSAGAVLAHDEQKGETTSHYDAPKPETEAAAYEQLHSTAAEIDKILANKKLTDADFEKVHEKSYALKSALHKLEENVPASKKEQFAKLKHETEEVHEEAEEHKEEKLRKHATAFNAALKAYEGK